MSKMKSPVSYWAFDWMRTDLRPVLAFVSVVSTLMIAEVEDAKARFWAGSVEPAWST